MTWEDRQARKLALVEHMAAREIERLRLKIGGNLKNEGGKYRPEVKEFAVELVQVLSSHSLPSRGPVTRLLGITRQTLWTWVATVPYTRNKHLPAYVQQRLDDFKMEEDA